MTEQPTRRSRRAAVQTDGGGWLTWTTEGRHRGEPTSAWAPGRSRRALAITVAASLATVGGTLVVLAVSPATTFRWGLAVAGRGSSLVIGPVVVDRADALPLAVAAAAVPLLVAAAGHAGATGREVGGGRGRDRRGGVTVTAAVLAVTVAVSLVGCLSASGGGACTRDDLALVLAMASPQLVVLAAVLTLAVVDSVARRRARQERRTQQAHDRPAASS